MINKDKAKKQILKHHRNCEKFIIETRANGKAAISSAWQVGNLLLDVKKTIPRGEFTEWRRSLGIPLTTTNRYLQLRKKIKNEKELEKLTKESSGSLTALYRLVEILPAKKKAKKTKKTNSASGDSPADPGEVITEIREYLGKLSAERPPSEWADEAQNAFLSLFEFVAEIKGQIDTPVRRTLAEEAIEPLHHEVSSNREGRQTPIPLESGPKTNQSRQNLPVESAKNPTPTPIQGNAPGKRSVGTPTPFKEPVPQIIHNGQNQPGGLDPSPPTN